MADALLHSQRLACDTEISKMTILHPKNGKPKIILFQQSCPIFVGNTNPVDTFVLSQWIACNYGKNDAKNDASPVRAFSLHARVFCTHCAVRMKIHMQTHRWRHTKTQNTSSNKFRRSEFSFGLHFFHGRNNHVLIILTTLYNTKSGSRNFLQTKYLVFWNHQASEPLPFNIVI